MQFSIGRKTLFVVSYTICALRLLKSYTLMEHPLYIWCSLNRHLCVFFFCFLGVMGEYEPKIEAHFPQTVLAAKGVTVRLECFALGK